MLEQTVFLGWDQVTQWEWISVNWILVPRPQLLMEDLNVFAFYQISGYFCLQYDAFQFQNSFRPKSLQLSFREKVRDLKSIDIMLFPP